MAARKKALRSTRNGMIFPINEDMAKSDDVEVVYVDDKGRVIEPEEVGPAAAMDLPNPVPKDEESSGDEPQGADESKDVEGEKEQETAAEEAGASGEKEQETATADDDAKATTRRSTTRRKG